MTSRRRATKANPHLMTRYKQHKVELKYSSMCAFMLVATYTCAQVPELNPEENGGTLRDSSSSVAMTTFKEMSLGGASGTMGQRVCPRFVCACVSQLTSFFAGSFPKFETKCRRTVFASSGVSNGMYSPNPLSTPL